MKIRSVNISNFTAISHADLSFSPGINVFLGKNGTGKSHLMKLLYGVVKCLPINETRPDTGLFKSAFTTKLAGLFRPDDNAINRLVTRSTGRSKSVVTLETDRGLIGFRLTSLGNLHIDTLEASANSTAVFIPSREALALYEGFVQAYEARELSFDETYRDICVLLSGSPLLGPRLQRASALANPLEELLHGKVRLWGNRFYLQSEDGNLEAHLLSEGHRKIASLTHLILNGSLLENGILFWDEPEANLNPRLITSVAKTLQRLAAYGVQVFVTTHDYLLASELSLASEYSDLMDKKERADIKFFGLEKSPRFSIQSGKTLAELESNDLIAEFADHYDRQNALVQQSLSLTSKKRSASTGN